MHRRAFLHASIRLPERFGVPRHQVMSCSGRTLTNLAYRGRELFVTDAGTGQILKSRVRVPGQGATA